MNTLSPRRAVSCGVDWAEDHHDVALVDAEGAPLAKLRISDDAAGFAELMALLAEHGDSPEAPIPVAIETSRGLLVAALRSTGRDVYAINPLAVARYRDRHSVARKKSDAIDAAALADILRVDIRHHRPMPADTELAQSIAVLARAQQDAVWDRTQAHNKLRSLLREYYPAILAAFADKAGGLMRPEARELLRLASTPTVGARLTKAQMRAALKRAGRQRGIQEEADRLAEVLRREQLHQLPLVEQACGRKAAALTRTLETACANAEELQAATEEAFDQHPDAPIITSFPGLAHLQGARILAEIGDDRTRFPDAKDFKAYAGNAPVTRASGKSTSVSARRVKNHRLATVGYMWTFAAIRLSPGARTHYDRRREKGERHTAAQRNLYNRFLGMPHHCLHNGEFYDERHAFPTPEAKINLQELEAAA